MSAASMRAITSSAVRLAKVSSISARSSSRCAVRCALLAKRASVASGAFAVFPLRDEHGPRIVQLMRKYRELPMDLADASLVVLAEALGHGRIFSTDQREFRTYRWKNRRPFENLLHI